MFSPEKDQTLITSIYVCVPQKMNENCDLRAWAPVPSVIFQTNTCVQ